MSSSPSSISDPSDTSDKHHQPDVIDLDESLPSPRPCLLDTPMNTSTDQSCTIISNSPSTMIDIRFRSLPIHVECFGLIQSSFNVWFDTNVHRFEDESNECLYGTSDLLDMYLDSMTVENVTIGEVLLPSYKKRMENIVHDNSLNIHGLGIYQLVIDGIRDSLLDIAPYHPFHTELNVNVYQEYKTYGGRSRPIEVLLLNQNPWDAAKNPILQSTCIDRYSRDQFYIFYHGCTEFGCHSICLNGIGLHWSNSKGTDFGPGIYVAKNILDALRVAQRRVESQQINTAKGEQKPRPCCIVFCCPKDEYDRFSTLDLSPVPFDSSLDRPPIQTLEIPESAMLQWHNFVHMCHDNRYPSPLVKCYDSIQGPVCCNIREVQAGSQFPRYKSNTFQLCVRSVALSEKFESWIKAVVILESP